MTAVAVLVGSLREESLTRRFAQALVTLAPPALRLEVAPIGHLKFYNPLLEAAPLPEWTAFRHTLRAADGVLFVTPESPGAVPGVLRNAIDVGARPAGQSAWEGKPGGVVSVGPGPLVAATPGEHLRRSLEALKVPTLALAGACRPGGADPFDRAGRLADQGTHEFLLRFMVAFSSWIDLHHPRRARASRETTHG